MGGMALPGMDSSVGHSFSLEIEGVQIAGIAEISGLALEQEVIGDQGDHCGRHGRDPESCRAGPKRAR